MICLDSTIDEILKNISEEYEQEGGITNLIKVDLDGKQIERNPIVDSDDDLFVIRNNLQDFILSDRTLKILLVVNAYKKNGKGMCKVIMVHHVADGKESIYFAKCKKDKSRKFLSKFTKFDMGEFTGLFGDLYNKTHKEAI